VVDRQQYSGPKVIPSSLRTAVIRTATLLLVLASFAASADGASNQAQLAEYTHAVAASLPAASQRTLTLIEGTPRQLLALRSYVRAGNKVAERWSWTDEQIQAFGKTREYRQLLREVKGIKARFEADNPGYTLYANTEVRSLDVQIERWNENASVKAVARRIERAALKELAKQDYSEKPDALSVERFAEFLRRWHPPTPPALAAPGLSKHGQLRAIDFAIFKDGKLIAPTNLKASESVWVREGWSDRLKQATLNTRFEGPLQVPHEPWHYEYDPAKKIQVAQKCDAPESGARC
jgi:hypothetical protein